MFFSKSYAEEFNGKSNLNRPGGETRKRYFGKGKENLCWLSVWNTGFKLMFLFMEKTISIIQELEIDGEIKNPEYG